MNDTGDKELTLEAKQAIRNYLLKLMALPAIVVAVLSFTIGMAVNEGAGNRAATSAMSTILPTIKNASDTVQDASLKASIAKSKVEEVLAVEQKRVEDLGKALQVQNAIRESGDLIANLKQAFVSDKNFQMQIVEAAQKDSMNFVRYGDQVMIKVQGGPLDGNLLYANPLDRYVRIFDDPAAKYETKLSVERWK